MKIYWVCAELYGKCFFRFSLEEAQHECDFRMEEKKKPLDVFGCPKGEDVYGDWYVLAEEKPDELFGTCQNKDEPRLPYQPDCSVGMIRKDRAGILYDDGTCGTCPYFIKLGE